MRFICRSTDSVNLFPSNAPYNFKVQLPQSVHLKGAWGISLREISMTSWSGNSIPDEIYIYCNLCDDSVVGSKEEPLLKRVYLGDKAKVNRIIWNSPYTPVRLGEVYQIHIFIKDIHGNEASFLALYIYQILCSGEHFMKTCHRKNLIHMTMQENGTENIHCIRNRF